jgi:flagellar motor switch protein FliM
MEKVLNQEEIDAMVRAARGHAEQHAVPIKVQPWDFSKVGQIGREPLRSLTQLHESLARNLTHSLGAYLRVVFDANLVSVEQLGYAEFLSRLPELAYLATVQLEPMNAVAGLQLDLSLAFPIIDLLLGGHGSTTEQLREITDIEEQILEGVVRMICREFESAWQPVGVHVEFGQRQQPAQMQRLMPPNEKTLSLSFEIRMPETRGMLNLVVPSSVSNVLLRKLSHDWIYHRPRGLAECSSDLLAKLLDCNFDLELVLPPQAIEAKRIINLSSGHVLALNHPLEQSASAEIGGHACFTSDVVRHGNRRAGHIRERLDAPASGGVA